MPGNWATGAAVAPLETPATGQGFTPPPAENLGDLLDFQRAALQEAIFHGGTSDENRARLRKVLAGLPKPVELGTMALLPPLAFMQIGAKHYAEMPHAAQGIYDSLLDTVTDPLTLETLDTGGLAKLGMRMLAKPIAAIDKAHIPVWGPGLLTDINHAATRLLNFGGDAINKLGRGRWSQAVGMLNRQRGESRELFRRLKIMDDTVMAGLDKRQTSAVQKILHGQLPAELEAQVMRDPKIAQAVRGRKQLTDTLVRMQASGDSKDAFEALLGRKPLPKELQDFAGHPGQFNIENYRQRYFPGHMYGKVVDPNQPAAEVRLLDKENPHIREQQNFKIPSSKVDEFEKAFEGMLKTSANAITTNKAREELGKIYGGVGKIPQAIHDIFTLKIPATGTERSFGQKVQESIKGLVNLPKLGIVGTSPIHMFNIMSILLARAPEQVPLAALHMARIMRAGGDDAKRFEAMLPAIERGIDVATHEKQLPGIMAKAGVGKFHPFEWMNRQTWNLDTAVKMALSDKYIKAGMHPIEAGVKASNELVNYANRSPLTGFLQYFMPFATFAEGGLKAVASAIADKPALVNLENRLTNGSFLGGGDRNAQPTLYQPPANVGRGVRSPKGFNTAQQLVSLPARLALNYGRGKTTDLLKIPVAGALSLLPGGDRASKWMLSGRTPQGAMLDMLTSPLPYARDALDLIPLPGGANLRGYAPESPLNQAVFSSSGISLPPPQPKSPAAATGANWANPSASLGTPPATTPKPSGANWANP